jgi:hypothetical protein
VWNHQPRLPMYKSKWRHNLEDIQAKTRRNSVTTLDISKEIFHRILFASAEHNRCQYVVGLIIACIVINFFYDLEDMEIGCYL